MFLQIADGAELLFPPGFRFHRIWEIFSLCLGSVIRTVSYPYRLTFRIKDRLNGTARDQDTLIRLEALLLDIRASCPECLSSAFCFVSGRFLDWLLRHP